jgi:tetratricopeptide (TPR) repeat protein/ferredoxin
MTVYFLGSKGFCTYACPYGGFFAVADKFAPGKIRVTDACNQCGHCTAACTSNVVVHAEVAEYGMVVDPGCMKCMDCVSVCPNDALYFGFGRPSVGISTKATQKSYTLTWSDEIIAAVVFFAGFMAVWDVYQLVPMLMALGIACVTTFVALRTLRMFEFMDVAFYNHALRAGGKLRAAGWAFLAFSTVWIGLNIHSGWIRYHEYYGASAFNNLQVPDELALARSTPGQWLSPSDKTNVAEGLRHFGVATTRGIFTNVEAQPKIGWLQYLNGNTDMAVDTLDRAAALQSGEAKGLSLYYRGAILNRVGRYDEALTTLDAALAAAPSLILAREERGESLWQLGRTDEAAVAWQEAVSQNPELVLANYQLAGAAARRGDAAAASDYEERAGDATPDDAYFRWVLAARLQHIGMTDLARKQYDAAVDLDPKFRMRPVLP